MKCPGQLFPGVLLSQSQLRSKPPQLKRPSFQLSMASTEGVLCLLVQHAITFLVASRLDGFLGVPAFSDIEFESDELDDLPLVVASGLSPALYPRSRSVRPNDAERTIKGVLRIRT